MYVCATVYIPGSFFSGCNWCHDVEGKSQTAGGNSRSSGQAIWRLTALNPGGRRRSWNLYGMEKCSWSKPTVTHLVLWGVSNFTLHVDHQLLPTFIFCSDSVCSSALTLSKTDIPLASFKDGFLIPKDQIWSRSWSCTDCVHICLAGFTFISHNGLIFPSPILPPALDKTAKKLFVLYSLCSFYTDVRCKMQRFLSFNKRQWI